MPSWREYRGNAYLTPEEEEALCELPSHALSCGKLMCWQKRCKKGSAKYEQYFSSSTECMHKCLDWRGVLRRALGRIPYAHRTAEYWEAEQAVEKVFLCFVHVGIAAYHAKRCKAGTKNSAQRWAEYERRNREGSAMLSDIRMELYFGRTRSAASE